LSRRNLRNRRKAVDEEGPVVAHPHRYQTLRIVARKKRGVLVMRTERAIGNAGHWRKTGLVLLIAREHQTRMTERVRANVGRRRKTSLVLLMIARENRTTNRVEGDRVPLVMTMNRRGVPRNSEGVDPLDRIDTERQNEKIKERVRSTILMAVAQSHQRSQTSWRTKENRVEGPRMMTVGRIIKEEHPIAMHPNPALGTRKIPVDANGAPVTLRLRVLHQGQESRKEAFPTALQLGMCFIDRILLKKRKIERKLQEQSRNKLFYKETSRISVKRGEGIVDGCANPPGRPPRFLIVVTLTCVGWLSCLFLS
jgi:hypothetical protein